jgi:hypothetical protein
LYCYSARSSWSFGIMKLYLKGETMKEDKIVVPLDVPPAMREVYLANYHKITHDTGRLMLVAGDQKVEHLN